MISMFDFEFNFVMVRTDYIILWVFFFFFFLIIIIFYRLSNMHKVFGQWKC